MMVVFKATLSFAIAALGIFLMRNQTATQSNPIKQKLPTFDNSDPCWSCNSLEEDQKVEDNRLAIRNLFYYHVLSNTINLLKYIYNCNPSTTELLSKSDPGIMASMLKPFVKYKSEQKQEKEQYQDQEKRPDQEKEQYQDQDQYKHQYQRQQEYEWKMVQKSHLENSQEAILCRTRFKIRIRTRISTSKNTRGMTWKRSKGETMGWLRGGRRC